MRVVKFRELPRRKKIGIVLATGAAIAATFGVFFLFKSYSYQIPANAEKLTSMSTQLRKLKREKQKLYFSQCRENNYSCLEQAISNNPIIRSIPAIKSTDGFLIQTSRKLVFMDCMNKYDECSDSKAISEAVEKDPEVSSLAKKTIKMEEEVKMQFLAKLICVFATVLSFMGTLALLIPAYSNLNSK